MKGRTRSAFEVVWRLPFLVRYTNHVFLFSKNELSLQPKLGSRKSRAHVRSSIQHFTSRRSVHNVWTRHGPSQVMDKLQMVEGEAPSRAEWMMKQHMGTSLDFSERCSTSYTYIYIVIYIYMHHHVHNIYIYVLICIFQSHQLCLRCLHVDKTILLNRFYKHQNCSNWESQRVLVGRWPGEWQAFA